MTGRAFLNSRNERSANLLVSSAGYLRVADDGPGLRGRRVSGVAATGLGRDGSRAYARSARCRTLVVSGQMLAAESRQVSPNGGGRRR